MITLYSYFRSSAAFRVRIALNYKKLPYKTEPVHLLRGGGEQYQSSFLHLNPQGLVPVLVDDHRVLTQSLAILAYLDEQYPEHPLLPVEHEQRSMARQVAQLVACEMHPLNNLRVLNYLKEELICTEAQKMTWYRHWIAEGFGALEQLLSAPVSESQQYCVGEQLTIADCCLVPQVYNALRFECDMQPYPTIRSLYQRLMEQATVASAAPEQQPE